MKKLTLKKNEEWVIPNLYKRINVRTLPDMCANCKKFDMGPDIHGKCGSKYTDKGFTYFEWNCVCDHHERDDCY